MYKKCNLSCNKYTTIFGCLGRGGGDTNVETSFVFAKECICLRYIFSRKNQAFCTTMNHREMEKLEYKISLFSPSSAEEYRTHSDVPYISFTVTFFFKSMNI